jgi:hypothetical protein
MPTLTTERRITSGSTELVSVWIDSNETVTLSAQTVVIAFQPRRVEPNGDTTWRAATWVGSAGTARAARLLIGPATSNVIPLGEYDVWAKITDNPEIPEVPCGRLRIY